MPEEKAFILVQVGSESVEFDTRALADPSKTNPSEQAVFSFKPRGGKKANPARGTGLLPVASGL